MVLFALSHEPMRHGQLERPLPGVSKKILTQTLRTTESHALVERLVVNVVPPREDYSLTTLELAFTEPLYDWVASNRIALDELERKLEVTRLAALAATVV